MKKITLLSLAATVAASQGATTVSVGNATLPTSGYAIVDNTGAAVAAADSKVWVGTFDAGFAAGLGGLDTATDDQLVLDNFTAAADASNFLANGLFNTAIQGADGDGSLGAASTPLFIVVTSGDEVLVFDFGGEASFPQQNATGAGAIDLGIVEPGDVVFGNNQPVAVTSGLPPFATGAAWANGITFNAGGAIPEPSTSLLAGLAGLALVSRRRR
jgi:hypothetical protein